MRLPLIHFAGAKINVAMIESITLSHNNPQSFEVQIIITCQSGAWHKEKFDSSAKDGDAFINAKARLMDIFAEIETF